MIVDKIQKLNQFLKNKPVKVISNSLDATSRFFTTQVKYAQIIIFSIMTWSLLVVIIPHQSNSRSISSSPTKEKTVDKLDKKTISPGSALSVKSNPRSRIKLPKLKKFVKVLTPSSKNIKRLPVSFIMSYSLSKPQDGVQFRVSLKRYQKYGQISIHSDQQDVESSYGFFADGYSLVKPVLPVLYKQITSGEIYSTALKTLSVLKSYVLNFLDDEASIFDVDAYRVLNDDGINQAGSSSDLDNSRGSIQLARSRAGHIQNTSSLIPNSRRFQKFIKHFMQSVYFKIDWLSTFVIRVEQ